MAVQNEGSFKSFDASEDLTAWALVKLTASSGTAVSMAAAGEGSAVIGVAQDATDSGDAASVALLHEGRTYKMEANGAISAGAFVYAKASGKIGSTGEGLPIGICLGPAATADGDIVEVKVQKASGILGTNTVTTNDLGNAQAGSVLVMPSGADVYLPDGIKGLYFDLICTDVTTTPVLHTDSGAVTDAIIRNGTAFGTTGDSIKPISVGAEARVLFDGTYWRLQARNGSTWSS